MWDSETKKDYRLDIPEEKKRLVDLLIDIYNIPNKGIILVLDNDDYKGFINKLWEKSRALHINLRDYGVIKCPPANLRDIMDSKQYSNIIWLSKRVCLSEEIEFAWSLAHELRHLQVDLICSLITGIGRFLYCTIGTINPDIPIFQSSIPTEFDADLMSLRVLLSLYGEERVRKFIDYQTKFGLRAEDFKKISKFNLAENYNVFSETIEIIRKNKSKLKRIDKIFTKGIEYDLEDVYTELSEYIDIIGGVHSF